MICTTLMYFVKDAINEILEVFNGYDVNLNFTFQLGIENKLSFLDIMIMKENGK